MPYRLNFTRDGMYVMSYRKRFWHTWQLLAAVWSRKEAEKVMADHIGQPPYYIDYDDNGYVDH